MASNLVGSVGSAKDRPRATPGVDSLVMMDVFLSFEWSPVKLTGTSETRRMTGFVVKVTMRVVVPVATPQRRHRFSRRFMNVPVTSSNRCLTSNRCLNSSNKKLVVTSATLLGTSALLFEALHECSSWNYGKVPGNWSKYELERRQIL